MTYELLPLRLLPERAEIISEMLRGVALAPTLFDEALGCDVKCIETGLKAEEMCAECIERMRRVSRVLGATDTRAWEVWKAEDLVGVMFFTDVTGLDALGHYVFFDHDLASKTSVISEAISEMWRLGLQRLTVEIPTPFVALASHAHRKLGFGGRFSYTLKGGRHLRIEGVKEEAARWRDEKVDVLILGLLREASESR